jgi:outer membrane protein TolC
VASYAWNGRNTLRGDAISDAFNNIHPTKSIGANFTVPLDVTTWTRALRGTNLEIEAAGLDLDQARITEARDWNELVSHLAEARARLKLTGTLEIGQKDKFENERQRLLRGRTTTYQTLTFEQDYASAQLLRLRTEAELLQIIAQMKTYRGNP